MTQYVDAEKRARSFLESLADTGRIPDSILIHGPAGGRRFETALHLVKSVNSKDGDRDGAIDDSDDPDLTVISPDGSSVKVGQIREMLSDAYKGPLMGPKRFLVVREAEKLTYTASQALLKSTEEAPDTSCIILLTSSPHRLQKTLESRMIKVGVRQSAAEIEDELSEFADGEKLKMAARMSDGSVGRAKSYLTGSEFPGVPDGLGKIRKRAAKLLIATFRTSPDEFLKVTRDMDEEEVPETVRAYAALLFDAILHLKGSDWLRNPDLAGIYGRVTDGIDEPGVEFLETVDGYLGRTRYNVAELRQLNGLLTFVWRSIRGI